MNLKYLALLSIFIIVCIPSIIAFEELFDDYVYNGDDIEIEGEVYVVRLSDDEELLFVDKEGEVLYVDNGSCTDTPHFQYCYLGTELDYNDYGRPIPGTMNWEPAIHFQVFSKKPDIEVDREHVGSINRDERVIVTVTIQNNGDLNIEDIRYEETIPATARIYSTGTDVLGIGNTIIWTKNFLVNGGTATFVYTLAPTNFSNINLKVANLTFLYEDTDFSEVPPNTAVDVNSPYSITQTIDDDELDLEDVFVYKLDFKNEDWNDRINVNLKILLPDKIEIVKMPQGVYFSEKFLDYDFTLQPDESKVLEIDLKSRYAGDYQIQVNYTVSIRDEFYGEDIVLNVSVLVPQLEIEFKISKEEVYEGNYYTISASMKNAAEITFYDISGIAYGPLMDTQKINLLGINPGKEVDLFSEIIKAKPVDEDETYNLIMKGTYRTPNHQFFDFEKNVTLKIMPVTIGFDIKKTVDKVKAYPNEEITVTTKVHNLGQKISIVSLEEEIPEGFIVIGGSIKKTLTLGIDEEEEFYIYKVKVLSDTPEGTYSFYSHLNYEDLVLKDEVIDIEVLRNETENKVNLDTDKEDDSDDKESKGFFAKIINWFKGFFNS